MKAYSIDFRQKIIDTYQQEKISQRKLAKRFNVALSFTNYSKNIGKLEILNLFHMEEEYNSNLMKNK
jgi:transposase